MTKERPTAAEKSPAQAAQQGAKGNKTEKRFEVSLALEGPPPLDTRRSTRRPRSLRKERREGQIIFLFLLTALAAAVMWLISHLHP